MKLRIALFVCLVAAGRIVVSGQQEARLLRFPAIYGDQIVFSYAGDLYSVTANGGLARKLTNGIGYEVFPKFFS